MRFDVTFQEVSQSFGVDFGKIVPHPCALTYTPQTLTENQKAQARENIGAVGVGEAGGVTNGLILTDRTTGKKYEVYVDNGKLTMIESEG